MIVALLATGCQTNGSQQRLSLEEAKKSTVEFEGGNPPAPPRTTIDITELLTSKAGHDDANIQRFKQRADQTPPNTDDKEELAGFYHDRALAAGLVGRHGQKLHDLRKAVRLAESAGRPSLSWLARLAAAEHFNGSFDRAQIAIQQSIEQGSVHSLASLNNWRALILADKGDFAGAGLAMDEAQRALRVSHARWPNNPRRNQQTAYGYFTQANLNEARGEYSQALDELRRAIAIIDADVVRGTNAQGSPYDLATMRIGIRGDAYARKARIYAKTGRYAQADVAVREAVKSYIDFFGRYSDWTGFIIRKFATVLYSSGRADDAIRVAAAALDIYRTIGAKEDSVVVGLSKNARANSYAQRGSWARALKTFEAIELPKYDSALYQRHIEFNLEWVLALIKVGRFDDALTRATQVTAFFENRLGTGQYNTVEAKGILGLALTELGRHAEALAAYNQAVPVITSRRHLFGSENDSPGALERRRRFILEGYLRSLIANRDSADGSDDATAEKSFRAVQVATLGSVQRALSATTARSATRSPDLADIARRAQDTQHQLAAYRAKLSNVLLRATSAANQALAGALRARIETLEAARTVLETELESQYPDYAMLTNPPLLSIEMVQSSLEPAESLIVVYVGEHATYVWALPKSAQAQFHTVPIGRAKVTAMVSELRVALDPNAETLGDIPDFNTDLAYQLFKQILAPTKSAWLESDRLLFVSDGPFGQLPPSLLVTEPHKLAKDNTVLFDRYKTVPWLARSHSVTLLPSVASLRSLRAWSTAKIDRRPFIGFGDPKFEFIDGLDKTAMPKVEKSKPPAAELKIAGRGVPIRLRSAVDTKELNSATLSSLPRLPETADEIRFIATATGADPARDIFLGKDASESAVKSAQLDRYKIVAFATHGLVGGDLDGLHEPALALSSPKFAGSSEDGLLTMGEILSLRMDADWVVLSACNTAAPNGNGTEVVSGLGRAFFFAGTRAVLVSNWPVETTSAMKLMQTVFQRQSDDKNLSRQYALRAARLALIDNVGYVDPTTSKTIFSYAHPIFWAPFTLVGDGGA